MTRNSQPRRRILVLGGTGMLGRACVDTLGRNDAFIVEQTDRHSAASDFRIDVRQDQVRLRALLDHHRYDLVVNAIAVLRDGMPPGRDDLSRDAILVNAVFPHDLAEHARAAGARVIHISTDAVFAGRAGAPYDESSLPAPTDPYGASKWLGEPDSPSVLTIRCSIVGRNPSRPKGLLEWFRAQPAGAKLHGFDDYRWTPATTSQVARLTARLADPELFDQLRGLSHVFHFAPNPSITKWEMIEILNGFRNRDVTVEPARHPAGPTNLTLTTRFDAFEKLSVEPRPWPAVLSEEWQ